MPALVPACGMTARPETISRLMFSGTLSLLYIPPGIKGAVRELSMKRVLFLALLCGWASQAAADLSTADKKVADQIIKQCRDVYKHKRPCPCPYDQAKNDELCSTNSAYD